MVARYHRKAPPSLDHPEYAAADTAQRALVDLLSGLLRIADGLDRTHRQRVSTVRVLRAPGLLVVRLRGSDALVPEILGACRKKELAERVFLAPFVFEQEP